MRNSYCNSYLDFEAKKSENQGQYDAIADEYMDVLKPD